MRVGLSANFLGPFITLLIVIALSAPFVLAQIDTGAIVGTVRDPSGAAVPNARVSDDQRDLAHRLLAAIGAVEWVDEEILLRKPFGQLMVA